MSDESNKDFAFGKENYILVAAGTVLAILGYILMSGGGSDDPAVFSEELFSFRRMYISPIMIIVGLAIVGWGIMKKVKD
ncbi:DUF3098 domain-containing protein [Vicingus serpentipes]|jgi:DUF3098 family protein|uniref:DUF3098 domain-containing protein n=1 Tax=Vicingus serpentipes TaxID=1926625 RepID=A0A5C6RSN4_9FLAO|nr:DUF3098 domain-containing protein [Vicingus serpentipes]TXB64322.1 DUF3098 domain-containing protein [Vicingus serpentipes]